MPERYRISIYLDVFRDGLRIGEVCALQRRDIDPGTSILHIRRGRGTMDNERLTDTPKTDNSIRGERILLELLPLLQQFLDEQVRTKKVAWLFPEWEGPTKPVHPNLLRSWYSQARNQTSLPDLRFYTPRHTGLTWLAAEGATVSELMDTMGYADVDVDTAMRYQHSLDRQKDILAENRVPTSCRMRHLSSCEHRSEGLMMILLIWRGSVRIWWPGFRSCECGICVRAR